jgi:hypothetical protein
VDSEENKRIPVGERLPTPLQPVIVVCAEFQCLGYIDAGKVWRYDSDGKEIKQTVTAWEPCS